MPLPELIPIPEDAPKTGSLYRHFRGHLCRVIGTGYHTETGEHMVTYIEATSGQMFSRPLVMWGDQVARPDDGAMVPRFDLVSGPALPPNV